MNYGIIHSKIKTNKYDLKVKGLLKYNILNQGEFFSFKLKNTNNSTCCIVSSIIV